MSAPERHAAADEDHGPTRFRLRLLAACVLLVGLALVQSPGLLVPDTKLDLALAPLDFLQRSAHLWDEEGSFGQLQNQAYGYLWPMGPFFVLGDVAGLPAWVVQRLWLALVMCVAMAGAAVLARTLGVRSDLACIVAGFAYALSPRMLTVLGPISIEAWPSALAPWVLLPLVVGSRRGSPVRMAALAGVAVAMVGGVNAAATAAVLPLGVVWLLTREPGARRRAMMLWWPVFTVLATLWWLVPLFIMGAYSPPFLDFIEAAGNTTFPTNLFSALRGTSNWVPYIDSGNRSGNELLRDYWLALNSTVLLVVGLIGLALRSTRDRLFLLLSVLTGLLLVTMGHLGQVQGWAAPQLHELLDGALAPLRNVHKFDPVIRLPLVLGLAWALQALADEVRGLADDALWERINLRILTGIVLLSVAAAATPAAGRITPTEGFTDVPDYWRNAVAWLGDQQDRRVALLVPGSSFGEYVWGRPQDEPIQSLATQPWAVRNAVPLAPPGTIRMLDAIEDRIARGAGSRGLATFLRRAGISHLLVRNDLSRSSDVPDPVLVHQALEDTPGLSQVATFGPTVGGGALVGDAQAGRTLVSGGWQTSYPALEVWALTDPPGYAMSMPADATVVVGGPEDLLDLADLGVLADEPVVLAADRPDWTTGSADSPLVLTDGMRAVERNFGRLHDAVSETRSPDDRRHLRGAEPDYRLADPERWATEVTYAGIVGVDASSSQSWADAEGPVVPGRMPYAALDGHVGTSWSSSRSPEDVHWWEVELEQELGPRTVTLRGGDVQQEVTLTADDWVSGSVALRPGEEVDVDVPVGFSTLRVSDASGREATALSLAEVSVPGTAPARLLEVPEVPDGAGPPDVIALRPVTDPRTGCARVEDSLRCVSERAVPSEEPLGFARRVTMPAAASYAADLRVRGVPGRELDQAILGRVGVEVSVSSTSNPDVRAGAVALVDGDPSTTWTAAVDEVQPRITMSWLKAGPVTGLVLSRVREVPARLPQKVEVSWPEGEVVVEVGPGGQVRLPRSRTDRLSIKVLEAEPANSVDFGNYSSAVPVGIGGVQVVGVPYFPIPSQDAEETLPCGSGPTLTVGDRQVRTRVTATRTALQEGRLVPAAPCRGEAVELVEGGNDITVGASEAFTPAALVLRGSDAAEPRSAVSLDSYLPTSTRREVDPSSDEGVALRENVNPGWVASRDAGRLDATVADGWRQAWRLDEGQGSVGVRFAPDTAYRAGLVGGLVVLMVLVVGACLPRRSRRTRTAPLPELGERVVATPLLAVALGVVAGLLAGTAGVAVAAGAGIVAVVVSRWLPVAGPAVFPVLLVPAGLAFTLRPWGDPAGWAGSLAWPSYFVLAAVLGVGAWIVASAGVRQRSLSRRPGSSTTR